MVEVSVINAGKLKKALENEDSEQAQRYNRWKGENIYHMLGIPAGNEVAAKLAGHEISIGDAHLPVNYLSFLYRRKGLNYAERIHLRRGNMVKRTEQVASYWNRITKWVLSEEIKEDSDIVIYRSLRRARRNFNIRTMDKYPIRFIDDTYAIYTGQTFWLQMIATQMRNGSIQTQHDIDSMASIQLRDNPPCNEDYENSNPITEEMHGTNRYCEAFEEWYSHSLYQHQGKHFDGNDTALKMRAYWVWVYLLTYGYDIRTIIESLHPDMSYRGSLLLWKDGVCKFWEETYENSDFPPDRFAGLCGVIPNNLIGTNYKWSDSDCLFKER